MPKEATEPYIRAKANLQKTVAEIEPDEIAILIRYRTEDKKLGLYGCGDVDEEDPQLTLFTVLCAAIWRLCEKA